MKCMALFEDADEADMSEKLSPEEEDIPSKDALDPLSEPVALAAILSIGFSWFVYHIQGNKAYGIFVGLWAPTMLAAASYFKQLQLAEKLENGLRFQ
jgi:hypothetical protein